MSEFKGELRVHAGARFAIIASGWNEEIMQGLCAGAREVLLENGVSEEAIDLIHVPGSWELPQAAARLARAGKHAALIALGCVVRGETRHFRLIADNCAEGLMQVALKYDLPVLNGVLAVERYADAAARAGGSHGNNGASAAQAALEMVDLMEQLG